MLIYYSFVLYQILFVWISKDFVYHTAITYEVTTNPFDALLLDQELYDDTLKMTLLNIAEGVSSSAASDGDSEQSKTQ